MLTGLPHELVSAVREGRVVLLLGAGASFGAKDATGDTIPLGEKVAAELVKEFLTPEYEKLDFRNAYDLSCSQRDVRTVQKYIRDRLDPFCPADFHKIIPTLGWAGLLTTNYDLIIERAYQEAGENALQRLLPHVKDADGATSKQDAKTVLFVKLHGCISCFAEIDPPMIASTEQLISFRSGRKGQFDIFLEWSRDKTIVFVGYAFGDANLRTLLDEVVKEGDNRPRHYIVDPFILLAFSNYWSERRFAPLKMGFEDFLSELDRAISSTARSLTTLGVALGGETSFSKFMTVAGRVESSELIQYIRYNIDHIFAGYQATGNDDIRRFYRGFDLGWLPFSLELDIERKVSDAILSEHVITTVGGSFQKLIVLKGHAGSGKSVSLRRACWDAGQVYEKLCFFIARDAAIRVDLFAEIFSLTNVPIFLFLDGLSINRRRIIELLFLAKGQKKNLCIIGTESFNTWNTSCADLENYVSADYEMHSLSVAEIDSLLEKLSKMTVLVLSRAFRKKSAVRSSKSLTPVKY